MTAPIRRTGADWLNPPAPLTPWQRERRDGPLTNDDRHDAATPWIIAALILFSLACLMAIANGGVA